MSRNVKSYFDVHVHSYSHAELYSLIIDKMKKTISIDTDAKLLDVGCGDGSFIKSLIKAGLKMEFFATDLSFKMLKKAQENLRDFDVLLFAADAFSIPIKADIKFDVIHIDSVLHHLIGKTRGKSMHLIKKMVELLASKLSSKGILIVEEWYYQSYIVPKITSFLVFYGLKIINFLNLDLSKHTKEIRPGLEVNFMHPKELREILAQHGSVYLLDKTSGYHGLHGIDGGVPKSYRLFLLKESGHITYVLKTC
jgi:SAM-dependent methyltransferase